MNRRQAKKILRRVQPEIAIAIIFGPWFDDVAPPRRGFNQAMAKWCRDCFTPDRGWGRWNPERPAARRRDLARHEAHVQRILAMVEQRLGGHDA